MNRMAKYNKKSFSTLPYTPKYVKGWKKHPLWTKAIDSQVEKRMVEIAQAEDDTTPWLLSRVDHFPDGGSYGGSHKSPNIAQMIKLDNNTLFWQDLTQLSQDPSDDSPDMSEGLYNIKTIQSRLRFYINGLMPVHVRVAIVKINNSGQYGKTATNPTLVNADIIPNSHMIADTSLRYSGIHKIEQKTTAPGDFNFSTIASAHFKLIPSSQSQIFNTTIVTAGGATATDTRSTAPTTYSRQVYNEREIILTKSYKNYLKLYQTQNQTAQDDLLTSSRNSAKYIGDRLFLLIYGNYQQGFNPDTQSNTASTSNIYFYGTSGCIYNYNKKETQVSIPLPDAYKITNKTFVAT